MKRRMLALAGTLGALLLIAALALPASADSAWVQEYQRPTQDSRCASPVDETPWQSSYSGQREWTPSWSLWPGNGQGGWVCTRTVVWARASTPAPWVTAMCTRFNGMGQYVNYLGGWALASGAPIYSDSNCIVTAGSTGPNVVFAANGTEADAKCAAVWPGTLASNPGGLVNGNYSCV